TICKMLNREIEPANGQITINEKNILDYSLKTIRENITYVGQKEKLFTDTIKNNILYFRENDNNFDRVCKLCFVEDIVAKKPLRYESGVSNDAVNLSGGEKQRIVLARAMLNNSGILILDEALSEVDYDTERKIILNLFNHYPEKTIIYVTHKNHKDLFKKVINVGC
ncbi:MAG: ABC transporter ATP-binding protein, partial [Bacilli bacterium]|nr:ABC transporter ATP-binding protein [Bacilli bacterium]